MKNNTTQSYSVLHIYNLYLYFSRSEQACMALSMYICLQASVALACEAWLSLFTFFQVTMCYPLIYVNKLNLSLDKS